MFGDLHCASVKNYSEPQEKGKKTMLMRKDNKHIQPLENNVQYWLEEMIPNPRFIELHASNIHFKTRACQGLRKMTKGSS